MSSASSFLSFIEGTDHLDFKDITIVNKRSRRLLCVPYKAQQVIEREISLNNNATLRQSELIRMFLH